LLVAPLCLGAGLACSARADDLKRRAFLGAQINPLSDADRTRLGVAQGAGVRVAGVLPNGAAEKAGVKPERALAPPAVRGARPVAQGGRPGRARDPPRRPATVDRSDVHAHEREPA